MAMISLTLPVEAEPQSTAEAVDRARADVQQNLEVVAAGGARVSVEYATRYAVRSALARCVAAVEEPAIPMPDEEDCSDSREAIAVATGFAVRSALLRAAAAVPVEAKVPRSSFRSRSASNVGATRHVVRAALERAADAATALPEAKDKHLVVDEGRAGLAPVFSADGPQIIAVKSVVEGSAAQRAGVREGDEILSVNGIELAELSEEVFHAEMQVRPLNIVLKEPGPCEVGEGRPRTMSVALATKHAVRAALARAALAAGPGDEDGKTAQIVDRLQETVNRAIVADATDRARESEAIEELTSSFVAEAAKKPWAVRPSLSARSEAPPPTQTLGLEPRRWTSFQGRSSRTSRGSRSSRASARGRLSMASVASNLTEIEAANDKAGVRASQDLGDEQDWSFCSGASFHSDPG